MNRETAPRIGADMKTSVEAAMKASRERKETYLDQARRMEGDLLPRGEIDLRHTSVRPKETFGYLGRAASALARIDNGNIGPLSPEGPKPQP